MRNLTNEQLMTLHQHGNEAAFTELFNRHSGPLEGFIVNTLKAFAPALISDAPDILQNVFAFIHTYRDRFIGGTRFQPWLYMTAKRMVRNQIEHETRQQRDGRRKAPFHLESWCPDLAIDPTDIGPLARTEAKAAKCLSVLPPTHQQVIQLIYFEGLTSAQTAERLGVPKTTVDWYKREALKMMREWGNDAA